MALTCPRLRRVTIPLRRYQTPSRVRQTSSASILPPLVKMITGLPPWRVPIPGPLVDTGSVVARECEVETLASDEGFGDGDGEGDGDGDAVGLGDGSGANDWTGTTGAAMFGVCDAACCVTP